MGKKTPKAPVAPDPVTVAKAQTESNVGTAIANANLNRINQYTPEGSLEFKQIGTNADGTPQYSSTQSYSPEQQKLYENELAVSNSLSDLSLNNVGRVSDAQSKPFNYEGMTPLKTGIDQPGVSSGYSNGGPIQKQIGDAGSIQNQYDFGSLTALPGAGDYGAEAKRVQDAVYGQATSRLDPRFEQEQRQLATQLAGKGVTENSEAYRRAMDQFARQKTDAYNQATYSGIQAGGQEQSRLFGLSLAGRQQGAQEAMAQGDFGNAAQQQQYNQQEGRGQFANMAQGQQDQQNLSQASFGNQAAGQVFGMNQQNAAFNNAGRQQQIQEATYLRNLPLNEISSLMGASGGVSQPQFADYNATNVNNTDYSGIVQQGFQNQQQQYQQKMAQRNAALGSIFGLAGSAAGLAISDRRLKESIKAIGELANGLTTYVFSYLGESARQFGVMADEVIKVLPDAVHTRDDGYMMVDYGKVW